MTRNIFSVHTNTMDEPEKKNKKAGILPRDERGHFISPTKDYSEKPPAQPRDEHGHFTAKKTQADDNSHHTGTKEKTEHITVGKTSDDDTLINVHVGNPLRKITELLEDIKKQKAFSFTLKGSIGLMGVILTMSLIGVFGTTYALCDKGVQTHIGRVKVLKVADAEADTFIQKIVGIATYIGNLFTTPVDSRPRYRYILETDDKKTIHLDRGRDVTLSTFKDLYVYATGRYDSCSANLKVTSSEGMENY